MAPQNKVPPFSGHQINFLANRFVRKCLIPFGVNPYTGTGPQPGLYIQTMTQNRTARTHINALSMIRTRDPSV